MEWKSRAAGLADALVHPASRWHGPIAETPRHELVPNWWRHFPASGWTLRNGAADHGRWLSAAYSELTLVTRIGPAHADQAAEGDHPEGLPTSSSTLPGLLVEMYQHAMIENDSDVLCVTGTGYGTALLARRLGDHRVTSIDIDPDLVEAARGRLGLIGLYPDLRVCDITGPLPGRVDRIVSTVGLPGIPASWLSALRPGGRLVTNLAGTSLVIAADVQPDGGARGAVTPQRAGFMGVRHGEDYPPVPDTRHAWEYDGDVITTGRYPVVPVDETWELRTAYALAVPGAQHGYAEYDGVRTAVVTHPDGSWARATGRRGEAPTVHQSGPQRLWDRLDAIRHDWQSDGRLPAHTATVTVDPDGTLHLKRGHWRTTIPPAAAESAEANDVAAAS